MMKGELYPRYIETSAKYIQQPGFRPEMCGLWVSTEKLKKKKKTRGYLKPNVMVLSLFLSKLSLFLQMQRKKTQSKVTTE